ncbi:MAG: hypothetical protein ABEK84_04160, partial [Salinibacter sp.]
GHQQVDVGQDGAVVEAGDREGDRDADQRQGRRSRVLLVLLLGALGLGLLRGETVGPSPHAPRASHSGDGALVRDSASTDAPSPRIFHVCDDAPVPSNLGTTDWTEPASRILTAAPAHHSARDRITTPARSVSLVGTFTYGLLRKDLEGERVSVWIDDCSGTYRKVGGDTTNDDGRVSVALAPTTLPTPGRYRTYFYVHGDGSSTTGTLRVLPRGTEVVVFDVDGTLTTDNRELVGDLFDPLLRGNYVPTPRPKAAALTQAYRNVHGYQLVYLTTRPHWLRQRTASWLTAQGMAPGTLRLSSSVTQALPTVSAAGEFKAEYLRRLTETLGLELHRAYGNSDTDVYAYTRSGLTPAQIFLVGAPDSEVDATLLRNGYEGHVETVRRQFRPAQQPFVYR